MLVHLTVSLSLLTGANPPTASLRVAEASAAGSASYVSAPRAALTDTAPPSSAATRGGGGGHGPAPTPSDGGADARSGALPTGAAWPIAQAGLPFGGPRDDGLVVAPGPRARRIVPVVGESAVPSHYVPRRFARPSANAPVPIPIADSLVLVKHAHVLVLYERGAALRTYQVALGRQPAGDKQYLGDNRTPEGVFRIVERNPNSRYHLALRLSYPDSAHRARAAAAGRSAGGDIMIHGLPDAFANVGAAHREEDWTEGCIAVTNAEIEEIWRLVPVGAPIQIEP